MNKTIWKYTLQPSSLILEIPEGSEILSVESQNNKICIWFLVDPSADSVEREFIVYGTGHAISDAEHKKYIGSAQLENGMLVFHVFENIIF